MSDDELTAACAAYLAAEMEDRAAVKAVESARRRQAETSSVLASLRAALGKRVGRNITTRNVVIGDALVRVEWVEGAEARVRVEPVLKGGAP